MKSRAVASAFGNDGASADSRRASDRRTRASRPGPPSQAPVRSASRATQVRPAHHRAENVECERLHVGRVHRLTPLGDILRDLKEMSIGIAEEGAPLAAMIDGRRQKRSATRLERLVSASAIGHVDRERRADAIASWRRLEGDGRLVVAGPAALDQQQTVAWSYSTAPASHSLKTVARRMSV